MESDLITDFTESEITEYHEEKARYFEATKLLRKARRYFKDIDELQILDNDLRKLKTQERLTSKKIKKYQVKMNNLSSSKQKSINENKRKPA